MRVSTLVGSLSGPGVLTGVLRIPDAVGPMSITADLRAGKVICHVDIDAPRVGRPATRINWLVKQPASAPDAIRVEVFATYARASVAAELLGRVRAEPNRLVLDEAREIKAFRLALDLPLGPKRGRGKGSFADSVLFAIETFYAEVLQSLRTWTAKPPQMREESSDEPVAEQLVASSLSRQDGPETTAPAQPSVTWKVALPGPRGPSRREMRRLGAGGEGQDAEGWYADPEQPGQLRWWDGSQWSQHIYAG